MGLTMTEQIAYHEGFKHYIYDDSTGKQLKSGMTIHGTPTFGYGFTNIGPTEAANILSNRVAEIDRRLKDIFPYYLSLSDNRQRVLIDMLYNLGLTRLLAFHDFLSAVSNQDWITASNEMLDSKWATQVGKRARVLARMMQNNCSIEEAIEMENYGTDLPA